MLKNRQKLILNDLKNTKNLITAQSLAEKYSVSLRTIRNDIDDITFYLKDKDAQIIKVPGVGIRVESENELDNENLDVLYNNNFSDY